MNQDTRDTLREVVVKCRQKLEKAIGEILQGHFGIDNSGKIEPHSHMSHLSEEDRHYRLEIIDHLKHINPDGFKAPEEAKFGSSTSGAVEQLIREVAFTHLNRLAAFKLMEERKLIRESVQRGPKSRNFVLWLAERPAEESLYSGGQADVAYRHFLLWLAETHSTEISVLFSHHDPANRLFPSQATLDEVLEQLNDDRLKDIWAEDETIGWIYQYFTPRELRKKARDESGAPRNSYELAFRNQFYTPRYVVEFLVDNTLGRMWYEMRLGQTALSEKCRYMVRRFDEVFLAESANHAEAEPAQLRADAAFFRDETSEVIPPFASSHERNWLEQTGPNTFEFQSVTDDDASRLRHLAHLVRPFNWTEDPRRPYWETLLEELRGDGQPSLFESKTQDLWDCLLAITRSDRFTEGLFETHQAALAAIANEIRRRALEARRSDLSQAELLKLPVFIPYRQPKDPRDLKILDPACGSGHFLLYCFDLLETIYREAYDDPDRHFNRLRQNYPDRDAFLKEVPGLILAFNLHGIDIDRRASQIAALALWLRAQRAYGALGLKTEQRPIIRRANIVCAEPMPGEHDLLDEFVQDLQPQALGEMVRDIFECMKLAGEAGSLLKIEQEIDRVIAETRRRWKTGANLEQLNLWGEKKPPAPEQLKLFDPANLPEAQFWNEAESRVLKALEDYATGAANGQRLSRALFSDDAAQGFAFIELSRKFYDVVLMNPPFGEASRLSKSYIDKTYPRTKYDVYSAFIERWIGRLAQHATLGSITSRTGFFLLSFQKWREEILLKQVRTTVFADLGYGVLDTAMVETAAYCLEAL